MRMLIAIGMAGGLVLALSAPTVSSRRRLRARIEPFLSGRRVGRGARAVRVVTSLREMRLRDRRAREMREQLPVAIDLLTLCLLAGDNIAAAIDRIGRHVQGIVGTAFTEIADELSKGCPLQESLDGLHAKLDGDPAVARLVDAICTAVERGTPLAETLRDQSEDLRHRRAAALLESGGRREVLMLVPVVFLILPVVVVIALLPAIASLDLLAG